MKQTCAGIGSFIISVLFVLFPILLGYSIADNWKSFFTFLFIIIVICEFGYIWNRIITEV
jgi:hypothetical protein